MSDMHHPHENQNNDMTSPAESKYWLSLEQWANDPEFIEMAKQEFKSTPLREGNEKEEGWARREFLKLMGASMALATASCVRRPVQKIVPYAKQPEELTFAVPNFYTSTWSDGGESFGLLVKTREGRPIKVEGNPNHPLNKGALSARAQAHILSLYDPERLKGPKKVDGGKASDVKWDDVDAEIVKQLGKGGVVVLTGNMTGPTMKALVTDFCSGFKAKHVVWEAISYEEIREGQKASYGDDLIPFYHFDKAKVIVSVDADFLGTWIAPTAFNRQFSSGRKDIKSMNRLVVFDSMYSLTGANADLRYKIKPSLQLDVVMGLAHEIVVKKSQSKFAGNASVKAALEPFAGAAQKLGIEPSKFTQVAEDLWKNKGESLVVAGGLQGSASHAKELQIAVNFLNSVLENDGRTVDAKAAFNLKGSNKDLFQLIESMKKGEVKTLIVHRANPMYAVTADMGFAEALKKVEMVIYTGDRVDEMGAVSNYVLPDHHPMETWGDSEFADGVLSIHQPTIRPLYDTRSLQLSLMTWAFMAKVGPKRLTTPEIFYDYLREFWKTDLYPKFGKGKSFDAFWDEVLQTGVISTGKVEKASGSGRNFKTEALSNVKPVKSEGTELVLYPTVQFYDGTLANVAWLHELPDPVTKVTWDNYVSVSIATAQKLSAKEGEYMEVTVGSKKIEVPLHIQPGLHDDVVSVAVGYGRTGAGKVGNNIGANAYALAQWSKDGVVYSGLSASLKKTGKKTQLACTQGHHSMEGRKIVVEATLAEYMKDNGANNHKHKVFSIWSGHQYNGQKWGMSLDLNLCTGCSACVTACQAENNIPVVGKKYMLEGREMHWIRIDRYYVGAPENAEAVFQPVMCQHCDNAPCETVCPVAATTHSSDGLNDMAYNRCVGTRYCANNCPYKVRRYNWFEYTTQTEKPLNLQYNPEVTVRPRGVMEKCTFCVQRIKSARNQAKIDKRDMKDGDVQTACQQSCPTDAIVFGDVNDPESKVSKIFKSEPRAYALLEEFNAAPAVRYSVKIRNNGQATRNQDGAHKGGHA